MKLKFFIITIALAAATAAAADYGLTARRADRNFAFGEWAQAGGAIVHGCTIQDNALIGMGAIIMNHAVIGKNCIIGAGALITQGSEIPDNSLVLGSPGKIIRAVTNDEIEHNRQNAAYYVKEAAAYARQA